MQRKRKAGKCRCRITLTSRKMGKRETVLDKLMGLRKRRKGASEAGRKSRLSFENNKFVIDE